MIGIIKKYDGSKYKFVLKKMYLQRRPNKNKEHQSIWYLNKHLAVNEKVRLNPLSISKVSVSVMKHNAHSL